MLKRYAHVDPDEPLEIADSNRFFTIAPLFALDEVQHSQDHSGKGVSAFAIDIAAEADDVVHVELCSRCLE